MSLCCSIVHSVDYGHPAPFIYTNVDKICCPIIYCVKSFTTSVVWITCIYPTLLLWTQIFVSYGCFCSKKDLVSFVHFDQDLIFSNAIPVIWMCNWSLLLPFDSNNFVILIMPYTRYGIQSFILTVIAMTNSKACNED